MAATLNRFGFLWRSVGWAGSVLLQSLITLLLLVCLLAGTDRGTRLLLDTASKVVALDYQTVNGNLFQQLQLKGLRLNSGGLVLQIDQLDWELKLADLWLAGPERKLTLKTLQIDGLNLDLAASETSEPAEATNSNPPSLSNISLPIGFAAENIVLKQASLKQGEQHWQLSQLNATLTIDQQASSQLRLQLQNGPFDSQAALQLDTQWNNKQAAAKLVIEQTSASINTTPLSAHGQLTLGWNGQQISASADQFELQYADAKLALNGALTPQTTLRINLAVPDLGISNTGLGGSASAQLALHQAERSELNVSIPQLSWLGQTVASQLQINAAGDLAQQSLQASAALSAINQKLININSQFGWRQSISSLLEAVSQPLPQLLVEPALHFTTEIQMPNADIASTGMQTRANRIQLWLDEQGQLQLTGASKSGDGQLTLLAELLMQANGDINLAGQLEGQQYQLANTPEIQLVASPNLTTELSNQTLKVRGNIQIDSGYIELIVPEAGAITPSPDVYIIEDRAAQGEDALLQRDIAITLQLNSPLALEGQGFKGTASGQLRVIDTSGQLPRASGELSLAGQYQAYGQDLSIRRGKLIYLDSPLDDPGIDLEAIREVNQQIAGVRVSGLASQPQIQVFAEPALSETEALSYLVLGRGLDDSSEADANRLRSLAISLGLAGSGKVLKKYKDKIGVDELSIQTGSNSNEANLLVGRQLSEKLYLSTQIGLFEPVTKFYLRYDLSRRCYFLSETGQQQAADIVCSFKQQD